MKKIMISDKQYTIVEVRNYEKLHIEGQNMQEERCKLQRARQDYTPPPELV
jgi:hypothetical protein